jgi:alpha-glucosidase
LINKDLFLKDHIFVYICNVNFLEMIMKIINPFIFFLVCILQTVFSQPTGTLIGDRMVAFYPEGFIPSETLPSMALLAEPDSIGEVPVGWTIFPEFFIEDSKNCASIITEEDVDLYGTGEVTGDLRRNGTNVILWNTDNYGYGTPYRLYQSHPWIMAVRSNGSAFGILVDHTWKQEFQLNNPIKIISEGPPFRIIIIERDTPQELMMALSDLTGKIELPPLWALGYHQCRYSYYPASQVIQIANTFRSKNIPCDVIWMDIDYMNGYRIFTFNPSGFPDPPGLNSYLHQLGFSSIWMIDPGVKKEPGYFVYDQGTAGDCWVKNSDGNTYYGNVWPGSCAFPDFTMPETRNWWAGLYPDFMANGIDGVWNDMNEPAVFNGPDNTMPFNNIHRGGGVLPEDIHLRYHNVYGMLMVSATREGILQSNPDKRPFVLTRANFLGGQRYAAMWTGDNISNSSHMKMSVPMSLNLGLSGQPFNGSDIGGYIGSPGAELLGQWMALGAFYPFSRNHTSSGTDPQEPWAYGPIIENVSRIALERRYRLLPYLYTLFYESSQTGIPVMQPVFFADPSNLSLRKEDEAFLWGDDLLIIPSWAENLALPLGNWRKIYLINAIQEEDGYQATLKQREGTVIPLAEVAQSTATYSSDEITLLIAPDDNNEAYGTMYADAGNGFEYLNGAYLLTGLDVAPTGNDSLLVSCLTLAGNLSGASRSYRAGQVTNYGIFYSDWKNDSVFKIPLLPDLFTLLSSPQNGDEFAVGSDILLQAAIDGDLPVSKVSFYNNETELIGEVTSEPWEFNWLEVPMGIYNLKAVALANAGAFGEVEIASDDVSIQVGQFGSGGITYEVWWDIGGGVLVSDLTSNPDYPNNPDETSIIDRFEVPNDIGEEFGARVIGFVHPPVSATYTFWISGDDNCELWLSTDTTATNKELIAEVPGWSSPNEWEKYPEQHSGEILLGAGQKYFIMALQKEASDHDNLAVAWDFEGQSREIIAGDFLSPYNFPAGVETITAGPIQLSIFPNPAVNEVQITVGNQPGHLSILNMNCQLFSEAETNQQQSTIKLDLGKFENGVYLVRFCNHAGEVNGKMVVLK